LFGLFSRVAVVAIIVEMIGAIFTIHIYHGFFMNWSGHQKGEGFEYHLITIALASLIMVRGSGALSIDRILSRRAFGRNEQSRSFTHYANLSKRASAQQDRGLHRLTSGQR
jgi:putative oxidoreductase